jgi:hypothetical protein
MKMIIETFERSSRPHKKQAIHTFFGMMPTRFKWGRQPSNGGSVLMLGGNILEDQLDETLKLLIIPEKSRCYIAEQNLQSYARLVEQSKTSKYKDQIVTMYDIGDMRRLPPTCKVVLYLGNVATLAANVQYTGKQGLKRRISLFNHDSCGHPSDAMLATIQECLKYAANTSYLLLTHSLMRKSRDFEFERSLLRIISKNFYTLSDEEKPRIMKIPAITRAESYKDTSAMQMLFVALKRKK